VDARDKGGVEEQGQLEGGLVESRDEARDVLGGVPARILALGRVGEGEVRAGAVAAGFESRKDDLARRAGPGRGLEDDEAARQDVLGDLVAGGSEARNLVDPLSARLVSLKTGYHARISEAVEYVAAGNPAAAVRLMEPILQTHPEDEVLLNNLAVAYTHLGRNEKAREVLLRVIAIDETSFAAYINLTAAELELGMNAEAMRHGEAAVRYAPDVAKTRLVRARVYMAYGRWNEAYADLKKAVQIQGEDALHHLLLAEVCQKLNKHTEAVKEFEVALRLDQRMQYAWLELGFSAALLGDFQKATQAYEKAKLREGAAHPRVVALGRLINGG
jgi:Tfp pilus assembly protein PilF